jgi:hypothetical protein
MKRRKTTTRPKREPAILVPVADVVANPEAFVERAVDILLDAIDEARRKRGRLSTGRPSR